VIVGDEGIVKQRYHKPSNDASQSYDHKQCVTITFGDSPFYEQTGRILKETLGRHSDLHLELSSGKRIRIDATWTDYFGEELSKKPKPTIHCVDLAQAEPIIRFLEYLRDKQETGDLDPLGINAG